MDNTELFGVVGYALSFASGGIYIVSIFQGRTRPHLYTRLIFCILETIVFCAQLVSGAGPGAWVTGLSALSSFAIAALCFRYGSKDITRGDVALFIAALSCIGVWILVKDPLWSVLLAALIDVVAILPTYRKTWYAPETKSLWAWNLGSAKYLFSLFALSSFTLVNYIYPAEVIFVNSILVGIVLYRRGRVAQA